MKCREVRNRLLDYTTGNQTPAGIEEIEIHLAACLACKAELSRLRAAWERLGRLPEEEPREALRTRFNAMLARMMEEDAAEMVDRHGASGTAGSGSGSARRRARMAPAGWWTRRLVPQLGLALIILAVGVVLGWRLRQGSGDGELALLRAEVQQLRDELTLGPASGASAVDRLAAINSLRQAEQLPVPILETLVGVLLSDRNVNVRLAVVDALSDHLDRQVVKDGLYQSLRVRSSPMVQIATIDALVDLDDPQGQQVLQELAVDDRTDPAVRSHVRRRFGHSL